MSNILYSLSHVNRITVPISSYRGVFYVVKRTIGHINYLRNIRRGSRFSRVFRHIFEHNSIKSILATPVVGLVMASSLIPASSAANQIIDFNQAEEQIISQHLVQIKTTSAIQNPTENMNITQGYYWYHRGLDIDGITGDPIRSVMPGVVSEVTYSKVGYGNSVIVKHGDNLTTLYAHMSKIYVKPEQRVTLETVIGEIGSTGRSTGDHLHLEVRSGNTQINPLSILQ